MYNLVKQKVENTEPWVVSLSERIRDLLSAKKNNQKVVLYLYEAADTSTFRYRVYNVCQSLELSLEWKGVYFFKDELQYVNMHLDKTDVLIVSRFRWDFELQKTIDLARERGIRVYFDIDDMVYNLDYLPVIVNTLSVGMNTVADYDWWFAYISRLQTTAKKCDGIISTNYYLAGLMKKDLGVPALIIPNYTNRIQEKISASYYEQKKNKESSGKYVIGYFSGTPSHINDFMVVAPAIKKLLDKNQDIIFRIVGFMEMPDFLKSYESSGRIERKNLVDFVELQKEIAEVDVNIAPLVGNQFSNSKSELKYFEASIVGTVTVATPTYVFSEVIRHGDNGFLCEHGQWLDTLESLYWMNKEGKIREIAVKAHDLCVDRYGYANQVGMIENVLESILHS